MCTAVPARTQFAGGGGIPYCLSCALNGLLIDWPGFVCFSALRNCQKTQTAHNFCLGGNCRCHSACVGCCWCWQHTVGSAYQAANESVTFSGYHAMPRVLFIMYNFFTVLFKCREAYNMFPCNGILFNHEPLRRGQHFVTRKITAAAARISVVWTSRLPLATLMRVATGATHETTCCVCG